MSVCDWDLGCGPIVFSGGHDGPFIAEAAEVIYYRTCSPKGISVRHLYNSLILAVEGSYSSETVDQIYRVFAEALEMIYSTCSVQCFRCRQPVC